jgi:hypothetical protein
MAVTLHEIEVQMGRYYGNISSLTPECPKAQLLDAPLAH